MVALKAHPLLACPPDGVALVRVDETVSVYLHGDGHIQYDGNALWVAPLEVKTKVSLNTIGVRMGTMRSEPVFCG